MAGIPFCYLLVCFSLNQCNTYYQSISPYLPADADLNMFYWQNPDHLATETNQISLLDMKLHSNIPAISHWKIIDSGAMDWMPYYYYYSNPAYADRCSAGFVKLEPSLVFAQPGIDYEQVFLEIATSAIEQQAMLATFESSCGSPQDPLKLKSAHLLLDLNQFIAVINNYQRQSSSQAQHLYIRGGVEKYLNQDLVQLAFPTIRLDYADCVDISTTITLTETNERSSDSYPFVHVGGDAEVKVQIQPGHGSSEAGRFSLW